MYIDEEYYNENMLNEEDRRAYQPYKWILEDMDDIAMNIEFDILAEYGSEALQPIIKEIIGKAMERTQMYIASNALDFIVSCVDGYPLDDE